MGPRDYSFRVSASEFPVQRLYRTHKFVVRPLGGGLYSSWDSRAEYKLPPKGRTTNLWVRGLLTLMSARDD